MWLYIVVVGLVILLISNHGVLFFGQTKQDEARDPPAPWKAVASNENFYFLQVGRAGAEAAKLNAPPPAAEEEAAATQDSPAHIPTSINVKKGVEADMAADKLTAALQTELKRIGCYEGAIDNQWGKWTRRALAKFNSMASLDLPLSGPTETALVRVKLYAADYCKTESKDDAKRRRQMLFSQAASAVKPSSPSAAQTENGALQQRQSYLPPWVKREAAVLETAAVASDRAGAAQEVVKPVKRAVRRTRRNASYERPRREGGRRKWTPKFFGISWPFSD